MNQKQIGITVIIVGLVLAALVTGMKLREDSLIDAVIEQQGGSCYLDDGTCLHSDRSFIPYIIGYVLSSALVILGVYLIFFDKTLEILSKQGKEVSEALLEAKKVEKEKDEFSSFLKGFSEDEQKVLKAIKEQDGILQSTLRYRTGLSKSTLSIMLKNMEEKGHISRSVSGKTNKVFLRIH